MVSDSSDILGQQTMPVLKGNQSSTFPFSGFQSLVLVVVLVVIYVVGNRLRKSILLWREESYKLATRRRHGIPDSDLRPFNVAYSDAMVRARDDEKRRHVLPSQLRSQPTLRQREGRSEDHSQNSEIPYRSATTSRGAAVPFPGAYYTPAPDTRSQAALGRSNANLASNNAHHRPAAAYPLINGVSKPLSRQPAFSHVPSNWSKHDVRKRTLDDKEDEHELKKTKVEGEETMDGDDEPIYEQSSSFSRHKHGSKRGMQYQEEDEDDVMVIKKTRGKRARKVSLDNMLYGTDQDMDIDDEEEADTITELRSRHRGKKRDRAEAGSTFGGDEEESEPEVDNSKAKRRHRKRRTVAKRKSEVTYTRGKKREREGELDNSDLASEDDTSPDKSTSRKRRGRRSSHKDDEDGLARSDISMDDSTVSTRSKIRNIGDEWESNGVKYKIGPNGQRLRQALVKKARHKFVMPKDSQHPDRDANLQVCIECWLTEEEYRDAKAQHLLAWQDSPKKPEDAEKLTVDVSQEKVRPPQGTSGKSLLWSTSTSTTPTLSPSSYSPAYEHPFYSLRPPTYREFRHSVAYSAILPISPFLNTQVPTVRRISSTSRAISLTSNYNVSPKFADSTNGPLHPTHKVFSKWEKQELEAQAMMKIRELNRKKDQEKREEKEMAEKQERDLKAKLDEERRKASVVPSISIVPPEPSKPTSEPAAPTSSTSLPKLFANPATSLSTGATNSVPISNLFGKPPPSSVDPSGPSKSGFNFAPAPTGGAANNAMPEAPKPSVGFGNPAASSTPTPGSIKASSGFGFTPASGSSDAATNEPSKSAFSFPTSTTANTGGAPKPLFAFPSGTPAAPNNTVSGESLFSRIAPQKANPEANSISSTPSVPSPAPPPLFAFTKASDTVNPATSTRPATNSTDAGSGLKFSFGPPKSATSGATGTSAFGTNPTTSISAFPASSLATGGPTSTPYNEEKKPLFGFGGTTSAPINSNPFASTTTSTSNTPAAPKFSFPGSAFGTTQPSASSNGDNAKSAFGTGASNSTSVFGSGTGAFGGTSSTSTSAFGMQTNGEKKDVPQSAFGTTAFGNTGSAFGASNGTNGSAFGGSVNNKPAEAAKFNTTSAFPPATTSTSAFGSNSSIFGAKPPSAPTSNDTTNPFGSVNQGSSKNGDASKPVFSFASSTTAPAANGTSTPSSKPSTFSFGPSTVSTTPSSTTAPIDVGTPATPAGPPSAGGFSFKFGQASTTPAASPFGAASTTSAFGQPAASSSSASAFSFGQPKQS